MSSTLRPPRRSALLVGINYRDTSSELNGCYNDIVNVSQYLRSNLGYSSDAISILTDGNRGSTAPPQSISPTRENILAGISRLVSGLISGDEVVFHFSGHGSLVRDTNGDENTGYDSCLCPIDYDTAGIITDDELRVCLINKIPKGVKLYAILDCCHNGTGCDLRYKYEDFSRVIAIRPTTRWITRQKAFVQSKYRESLGDIYMISGSRDEQTSADAYINNQFAGALTYALMSTLRTNDIRSYSWSSLLRDLRHFMRVNRYSQIPQIMTGKLIYPMSPVFSNVTLASKRAIGMSLLVPPSNTISNTVSSSRSVSNAPRMNLQKMTFYH
jgi:metacaspase-1